MHLYLHIYDAVFSKSANQVS